MIFRPSASPRITTFSVRSPLATVLPTPSPRSHSLTQALIHSCKGAQPRVPLHIRNAPTGLMKRLGYGKGYKYTPKADSSDQKYLPDELLRHREGLLP